MSEKVIREYCEMGESGKMCILMFASGQYLHTLDRFLDLVDIAKKDFPELEIESNQIRIEKYGGDRRSNMWGIEFLVGHATPPEAYQKIETIELVK